MVENGKQVSIEYTLTLDDGSTVDTNVGKEPLTYEQGQGAILPALERELAGLAVNDTTSVKLPPEKGYGAVNPDAFREVAATEVPEQARTVGTMLMATDQAGHQHPIRVHEIKGDRIVLDFNHPLAGETLNFEIRILAID